MKNWNAKDWIAIGLLALLFYIVTALAIAVYMGHPLEHALEDKEVITFIIGALAGWIGGGTNNKQLKKQ